MTHEESNLLTKEALVSSLKKAMSKKPLCRITVSEIVADSHVNRKTFYYHFADVYDLLKWMLDREAVEIIKQFDFVTDYEGALRFMLDYVEKNAHILNCAYDCIGREQLGSFFRKDFYDLTWDTVMRYEEKENVKLNDETRKLLCDFIIEGLAGLLVNNFKSREVLDKERFIAHANAINRAIPDFILQIAKHNG